MHLLEVKKVQETTLWKGGTPVTGFFCEEWRTRQYLVLSDYMVVLVEDSLVNSMKNTSKAFFFFCAGSTKTHNHYKCAHYFHCNWLDRSSNGYFLRACLKMKHYLVFICASSKNECVCAHFAEVKNKVLFEHLFNILNILPS